MDAFQVSHTKDDIIWFGDQEDKVEAKLLEHCGDFRRIAQQHRKGSDDERGPSEADRQVAVDEFQRELNSAELIDKIEFEEVPPPELTDEAFRGIRETVQFRDEDFSAVINGLSIRGYIADDLSINDPYVTIDSTRAGELVVIINIQHPHIRYIDGSAGLVNYLRHCTYDAIAEWKAIQRTAEIDPDTIKLIKDALLRVSFELEMHESAEVEGES